VLGWVSVASTMVTAASLQAQTTASTVPVGYLAITVPAAASATSPSNAAVSVPFYAGLIPAGSIKSVDSASSFSIEGANWVVNQFTAAPHFVRIKSGAQTGRLFLITAHTANQLTVETRGYTLVSGAPATTGQIQLQTTDTAEIIPAHTLGTLFGAGAIGTGASAAVADNVIIWDGSQWVVYFHDGTSWLKSGSFVSQNDAPVRPDTTMFIVRRALTPLDLVLIGTVPSGLERTDIPGPGSVFASRRFPVDTTLGALGLHSLPGWAAGSSASAADEVDLWNGSTWESFYYNGSNWKKAGSFVNADSQPVAAGTGLFITRRSSATGTTATLAQPLPYIP
jgi:uncharacterized protein (TIGR02597 family)